MCAFHIVERCGAVVKIGLEIERYRVRSLLTSSVVTLSKRLYPRCLVLVSTQEKKRATWKISTSLLNVLPSINKVDYYYYLLLLIPSGHTTLLKNDIETVLFRRCVCWGTHVINVTCSSALMTFKSFPPIFSAAHLDALTIRGSSDDTGCLPPDNNI